MTKTIAPLFLVSISLLLACDEPPPPAAGALRGVGVAARPADDARTLEGFCDVHHPRGAGPSFTPPPVASGNGASGNGASGNGASAPGNGPRWLNVWATWCAPCVEELPRMARFRDTLVGEGTNVEVTYVSADASDAAIETFRRRHPSTPETGRVPELAQLQAWLPSVGLDSGAPLPVHVFVGTDGKVRCARAGGIDDDDLEAVRAALR